MSFAYLPFYTGDYFRDTRGLSMAGHGCYFLLLTYCWDSKGPLPLDEERTAGICEARNQEERLTMQRILQTYFVRMEDGWYQPRMQREIERCHVLGLKRKSAGAKGYQARAKHLPSKSYAIAEQELDKCLASASTPSPTSYHPQEKLKDKPARKRATPLPKDFGISEKVRVWAATKNYDRLEQHLEVFLGYVIANGKTYTNWDQALQNCIHGNWAKVPRLSVVEPQKRKVAL